MNGKQRIKIAMQGGIPDQVPIMCQLSAGHYFLYSNVDPLEIWFSSTGFCQALINLQKQYQFDGILVNLSGRQPNWRKYVDRIEEKGREKWIWWENGNLTKFPPDDNPHYYLKDGTRSFPSFDELDPEMLHYVDPWNLTGISYPFVWDFEEEPRSKSNFFPEFINDAIKEVLEKVGQEISVHGEIFSPFSQFMELLNYQEALMALLMDPEKCHQCLNALTAGTIELGIKQAKSCADAILISSAFAGSGFISKEFYAEFVLPYEQRVIHGIKTVQEIPVYTHTCGGIGDRLDLMMQSGTNGIDTLDPPPLGTVELSEAIRETKGKVFIKGNLDAVNTLLKGDFSDIEKAVLNRLAIAKSGGGYIMSTACSVAPPTSPESIQYLTQITHALGKYENP